MSLAYLGTSAFAAGVLRRLADAGRAPDLVVTRPDRPAGRGRVLTAPPVAEAARELGLEVLAPERVSEDERVLACDVCVVCAYGAIIRSPLLERGVLNIHPSLLPRWRGAAPIERAIMAGDAQTGVAVMRLVEALDEGPVAATAVVDIGATDDFATVSARLEAIGTALLLRVLDAGPDAAFAPQRPEGTTYAEKIGPADRTLDPARTALENDRVVRALHPHIGARLALVDGSFLRVLRAAPGDGPLTMACADGPLELLEVQPAGGRAMAAADYLRGRAVSS